MRFMMLMIPKGYETAKPGTMPEAKAVAAMMKYNEELAKAGVLLSLALAITIGVGRITPFERGSGDVTWRPSNVAELASSYNHGAGTVTLDLTSVDFSEQQKTIKVHLNAGDLRVILPNTVDTDVRAKVGTGDARVFGTRWSGIGNGQHRVTDNGSDGPGGGHLELDINVGLGTLEVNR